MAVRRGTYFENGGTDLLCQVLLLLCLALLPPVAPALLPLNGRLRLLWSRSVERAGL